MGIQELALGVDLWKAVIHVALGEKSTIAKTKQLYAAVSFFTAPPGIITNIICAKKPKTVHSIVIETTIGSKVNALTSSSDRLGHVIATGKTSKEAEQNVLAGINSLSICVEDQ